MTVHVLFYRDAQRDIREIEAYLDANAPDQRERFLDDLEAAIAGIAEHPLLRRVLPEIEHAEGFAVLHHSRGPRALEDRL